MEVPDPTSAARPVAWEEFRAFYERALHPVYSYVASRCGGREIAQDVTQAVFVAAVESIKSGSAQQLSVGWVIGIAKHKVADHFRRQAREDRKLVLASESARLDELPEWAEEQRDRAAAALAGVSAPQRAALVMRYLDGMSVPEIARVLGRSVHATESLLARGRESFRREFREMD